MADPNRRRGGVTLGLASAASLAIGLELLIYLALLGTGTSCCGSPIASSATASWPMRSACRAGPRSASSCSRHTPIAPVVRRADPSVARGRARRGRGDARVGAGPDRRWPLRLGRSRPCRGWLRCSTHLRRRNASNASKGSARKRPGYGSAMSARRARSTATDAGHRADAVAADCRADRLRPARGARVALRDLMRRTLIALPPLAALVLLFWQTRTGPAAQMMSIPVRSRWRSSSLRWPSAAACWVRIPGTVLVVVVGLGALVPVRWPNPRQTPDRGQEKGHHCQPQMPLAARAGAGRAPCAGSSSASSTSARG